MRPNFAEQISTDLLTHLEREFRSRPGNGIALNAVTVSGYPAVGASWEAVANSNHTFSHQVETPNITNQRQSGRCWVFAGLDLLRLDAKKSLGLEQFELSRNYLLFFDKLEKANFFLRNSARTADDSPDSRMTHAMLLTGVDLDETNRRVKWRVENS